MVDEHDADDGGDESVTVTFGPGIEGWPTARDALDAFLENQVVAAGAREAPMVRPRVSPTSTTSQMRATRSCLRKGTCSGGLSAARSASSTPKGARGARAVDLVAAGLHAANDQRRAKLIDLDAEHLPGRLDDPEADARVLANLLPDPR